MTNVILTWDNEFIDHAELTFRDLKTMNYLKSIASVLAMVGATSAYAGVVVDQSNDDDISNYRQLLWTNLNKEQSFTVGVSGLLTGLDVAMLNSGFGGTLTANIYKLASQPYGYGINGSFSSIGTLIGAVVQPTDLNLFSRTGSSYVHFDFISNQIQVTKNEVLAFSVSSPDQTLPVLLGTINDKYSGGFTYANTGSLSKDGDLIFKTYVDTPVSSVPLPPTSWQLLAGLITLGVSMKRKSKAGR